MGASFDSVWLPSTVVPEDLVHEVMQDFYRQQLNPPGLDVLKNLVASLHAAYQNGSSCV